MTQHKERVTALPIDVRKLHEYTLPDGKIIPYLPRIDSIKPPGMKDNTIAPNGICEKNNRSAAIESAQGLSSGAKKLLKALFERGGAALFGLEENPDMGIDYQNVFKKFLDPEEMGKALQELAYDMDTDAAGRGIHIDGILAPEASGVALGVAFSSLLKDKPPVLSVQKNGAPTSLEVAIDSYSKGKIDVMSIPLELLQVLQAKKPGEEINLIMCDDFFDSGKMTEAIALLLQLARQQGVNVNLVGVVVPIEKTYTGARKSIEENVGNVPIFSAVKIEDMGIHNNEGPWMKMQGVDTGLACEIKDFTKKI